MQGFKDIMKLDIQFSFIECAHGITRKYLINNPYNSVIIDIPILENNEAIWSAPCGTGKVIPAQVRINPTTVPINPNPQAKSPNSNKDDLSL